MTKTNLDVDELIKQACSLAKTAEGSANCMDSAPTSASDLRQDPDNTYGYTNGAYNQRTTSTLRENVPNSVESVSASTGSFAPAPNTATYRTGDGTPSYGTTFADPGSTSVSELRLGKTASAWLQQSVDWNKDAEAMLNDIEMSFAAMSSTQEYDHEINKQAEYDQEYEDLAQSAAVNILHEGVVCGMKIAEDIQEIEAANPEMSEEIPSDAEGEDANMDGQGALQDMMDDPNAGEDSDDAALIDALSRAQQGDTSALDELSPEQLQAIQEVLEEENPEISDDSKLVEAVQLAQQGDTSALDELSPEQLQALQEVLEEEEGGEGEDSEIDEDDATLINAIEELKQGNTDALQSLSPEQLQALQEVLDEEEGGAEEEIPQKTGSSTITRNQAYSDYVMDTINEILKRG